MHALSRFSWKIACGILFVSISLLQIDEANAQPALKLMRIINSWPTIEVYCTVRCQGVPVYDMLPQNFEIVDDGAKIDTYTLWCPDPKTTCFISVALVFDCSASMAGAGLGAEINAGIDFVGNMNGLVDEACVVAVQTNATLVQSMTTNNNLLLSAITGLTAYGVSVPWDGCYQGLMEIVRAGTNPCRAVILLSDGNDNASTHTVADIVTLATRNRIRVFTIGLGEHVNPVGLQTIADCTGGTYYLSPTPAQLNQIYEDISNVMREGFGECLITYQSECKDGRMHTVDLTLRDYCNGKDTKTKTYVSPLDSSSLQFLDAGLGTGSVNAGSEITIPLNLYTFVTNEYLSPFEFSIEIPDSSCGIQFDRIDTPAGSILAGIPITVTQSAGLIHFQITQGTKIDRIGELAELTFKTTNRSDSCCSEIRLENWQFQKGCFIPRLTHGQIYVIPQLPIINCHMHVPAGLAWDSSIKDYSPNPVNVIAEVTNSGNGAAKNARFRIVCDTTAFTLALPMTDVQSGMPSDVSSLHGSSSAVWNLRGNCTAFGKESEVCVIASFDNHPDVRCCSKIWIPAADPFPSITVNGLDTFCDGDSVVLTADPGYGSYLWSTSETTASITVGKSGTYFCSVQSNSGCTCITNPVTVTKRSALTPHIQAIGHTPLCEGDSVQLDAGSGYVSYFWNTGEKTRTISAKVRGLYSCYVEDSSHCGASTPAFQLDVEKLPVPVVIRNGNTLSTSVSAIRYEWSRDGAVLPGETNASLLVTQTGSYVVTVYSAGGCRGVSAPFVVDVVMSAAGVPAAAFTMDVYPEPNNGQCTVCIKLDAPGDVELTVCDMLGRTVYTKRAYASTHELTHTIDLSGVPAGSYVLRAVSGRHAIMKMLVKETR